MTQIKPPQWALNAANEIATIQRENNCRITEDSLARMITTHYQACAQADPLGAFVDAYKAQVAK